LPVVLDPVLAWTLRAGFALLFASAVAHKLLEPAAFRTSLRGYLRSLGLGGPGLERAAYAVVVVGELAAVVACLAPSAERWAAALVIGLLLGYAALMTIALRRSGTLPDCGCHWGAARQPVSFGLVLRNIALAAFASALALPGSARELLAIDYLSIGAGLLAAALLYTAAGRFPAVGSPAWSNAR
jgi:hypothetical protein